jgi:DNA invertase Pin-like site-specific DNA recombinase
MTDSKRALIWAAVSSKRQAEDDKISLEYQEARARDWCAANGYSVVEVLRVEGHSRSDPNLIRMLKSYEDKGVTAYARLQALWDSRGFDVLVGYSSDRLGRSGALIHWVIETTIHEDMRLYLTDDGGWVDKDNYRMRALFGTAAATMPMDSFKDKTIASKEKLAAQGLPTGPASSSHTPVRDPISGKVTHMVVNQEMLPIYRAAAQLIIEGLPWSRVGVEMAARWGYRRPNGLIYTSGDLYHMIYRGVVFGHTILHYAKTPGGNRVRGRWIFDEDEEAPEGVTIYHNTVPPLFEGEFMEQLKAELRRRIGMAGKASPRTTRRFSRLCVCDACGRLMSGLNHGYQGRYISYRCSSVTSGVSVNGVCSQRGLVSEAKIQAFIHQILTRYLSIDGPVGEVLSSVSEVERLTQEIARATQKINRAIDEQLLADEALQPRYRAAVAELHQQIQTLEAQRNEAIQQGATAQRASQAQAETGGFIQQQGGLEKFWQLPVAVINQWLHRFFGDYKVALRDKQVVGLKVRKLGRRNFFA